MSEKLNRLKGKVSNKVEFIYDGGNAIIETDGYLAGFQIDYIGKVEIVNEMPSGWILEIGKSSIIGINIGGTEADIGLIFTYSGFFEVKNAVAYSFGSPPIEYVVLIRNKQGDFLDSDPQYMDDFPERLSSDKIKKVKKSKVINREQKLKEVEDGVSRY